MAALTIAGALPPIITPAMAQEPILRIARQGSLEAGGRVINCTTNDGGDPDSTRWPSGQVVVDNVYATYQYPAERRFPHPILFNSGGWHTARVYDTTPDGRGGWLTQFVRDSVTGSSAAHPHPRRY